MILDEARAISTTLEGFLCVSTCVITKSLVFVTLSARSKEGIDQQDELKALHKLIDFFVLNQCQFVENFFPFL